MKITLQKLNETLQPYYALLTMLMFFGALFIGLYKSIIAPTDLRVTVDEERVKFPSSIGTACNTMTEYFHQEDTLVRETMDIYRFLILTTNIRTINISNTSSNTLRGLKIKQLNSDALTAWSVATDFQTSKEDDALMRSVMYDEPSRIIQLKETLDLPPNSSIKLTLWGNFKYTLAKDNLLVTYEGGEAYFDQVYSVSGFRGYLISYSVEFVLLLVLLFSGVYYLGIKYSRKNASETAG